MPQAALGIIRHGGLNGAIHAMAGCHAELPAEVIIGEIRDRIGVWRPLPAVTLRETAIDSGPGAAGMRDSFRSLR